MEKPPNTERVTIMKPRGISTTGILQNSVDSITICIGRSRSGLREKLRN
jgi:hypothetical protein